MAQTKEIPILITLCIKTHFVYVQGNDDTLGARLGQTFGRVLFSKPCVYVRIRNNHSPRVIYTAPLGVLGINVITRQIKGAAQSGY